MSVNDAVRSAPRRRPRASGQPVGRWRAGVLTLLLTIAVGACSGSADRGSTVEATGPASGPREVILSDGRLVFLDCQGSGSPTVVLESGYHDSSDTWVETDATPPVPSTDAFSQIAAGTRGSAGTTARARCATPGASRE